MNITVENLGVIQKASINLNKPLTVFCGHNSTGKTYLSYLLYSVLDNSFVDKSRSTSSEKLDEIYINGSAKISIIENDLSNYVANMQEEILSSFVDIFALSEDEIQRLFPNVKINIQTPSPTQIKEISFNQKIRIFPFEFSIEKKQEETDVWVSCTKIVESVDAMETSIRKQFSTHIIYSVIYHNLILSNMKRAFIMPVERNSIYTFNKELSLSRNMIIDKMQKLAKNEKLSPLEFLEENTRRYPKAISDGLKIANDLNAIKKTKGDYFEIASKIEKDLLLGELGTTSDGDVILKVKKNKLPIHVASSLVKTTSSLVFYLKHLSKKGDLVIIDEPEMNLHPDSQLVLVKIIIELMKNGLKFVISTHSDYFIRELNKYIMVGNLLSKNRKIPSKYEAEYAITPNDVNFYFFEFSEKNKKVTVSPIKPDEENCISIPSIDNVIEQQNEELRELYEELKYGETEE